MRSVNRIVSPRLSLAVAVVALGNLLLVPTGNSLLAQTRQSAVGKTTKSPVQSEYAGKKVKSPNVKGDSQQVKRAESGPPSKSAKATVKEDAHSSEEKQRLARSMLEDVLTVAGRITPTEYRILAQVEAATLLWQMDNERALSILKSASDTMRDLKDKDPDKTIFSKQRKLRFLAFLKIARLKPELVKELALDKSEETATQEWTDEARAVMTIAEQQMVNDPALAVQTAKLGFSLGQIDWAIFLRNLSAHDSRLAEQFAFNLIDWLNNSSITPIYLLNFNRFALRPERSIELKNYYLKSLSSAIRQSIRPDTSTVQQINSALQTAGDALSFSRGFPQWQQEFETIIISLRELLATRSASASRLQNIYIPMTPEIEPGDTKNIADEAATLQHNKDPNARDLRYQKLATNAALKADLRLAEEMMSQINSDDIRRAASLSVYGPYVTQAIRKSDWKRAYDFTSKILDPFGRTLALIRVAEGMSKTNEDKQAIKDVYGAALRGLQREFVTEDVARAFFILSNTLASDYPEASLDALSWAIYVSNKVVKNGDFLEDFKVKGEMAYWIRLKGFSSHTEVLELTEIIGPVFERLAKRDLNNARSVSQSFNHLGLYAIAQLGIVRALLEKTDKKQKHSVTVGKPRQNSEPALQEFIR